MLTSQDMHDANPLGVSGLGRSHLVIFYCTEYLHGERQRLLGVLRFGAG